MSTRRVSAPAAGAGPRIPCTLAVARVGGRNRTVIIAILPLTRRA